MKKHIKETVSRWNRPAGPIKQVEDCKESVRVFLENFGTEDMVGYARAVYLRYATREGIAADFAAINNHDSLCAFLTKHDRSVPDAPLDTAMMEDAAKKGLLTAEQAEELKQAMKDKEEGQQ